MCPPLTSYDWPALACPWTNCYCSRQIEADVARAEGTIVYAVGVGLVPEETLLSIGGDPPNVFDASDFTELDSECNNGYNSCVFLVVL